MQLHNLNIGTRLAAAFAVILLLTLGVVGTGVWLLDRNAALLDRIAFRDAEKERAMRTWLMETRSNAVRGVVLTRSDDAQLKQLITPEFEATSKRITELQNRIEKMLDSDEAKGLFADVGAKRKDYLEIRKAAIETFKAGRRDEAIQAVDTRMIPALNAYVASITAFVEHQKERIDATAHDSARQVALGRTLLVACGLAALVLGALLAWILTRSVTRPLREAVGLASAVAAGDLTARLEVRGRDETAQLMAALKTMNESLGSIVREVRDSSRGVASASSEIARGNADLSARTEEQASSLEETASSMEELTNTVKQNADHARQATQLVGGASQVAAQGGTVMAEVVSTMNGISDASRRIADIIAVIDGIAFQTNILALNAAVEAARAGDQGRGFAVVASEVRALAQRSATAAKEIKGLIENSVGKVANGTKLVEVAGGTMADIVSAVKRANDVVSEIAAASGEQLRGIEQIGEAIAQMDRVVQENAALVEESAAAAENMSGQADQLVSIVARFKIEAGESRPALEAGRVAPRVAAPAPARALPDAAREPARGGATAQVHALRAHARRKARGEASAAPARVVSVTERAAQTKEAQAANGEWREF
jgi:methyl-accepting chemotaxis protein